MKGFGKQIIAGLVVAMFIAATTGVVISTAGCGGSGSSDGSITPTPTPAITPTPPISPV